MRSNKAWYEAHKEEVKADRRRQYVENPPDRRQRNYGISDAEYRAMVARQNGACWICKTKPHDHDLYVDHCHRCGKVGRLLCRSCNFGLGHYKDDPRLTRAATGYLEKFRCNCCCPTVPIPRRAGRGTGRNRARTPVSSPTRPAPAVPAGPQKTNPKGKGKKES